MSYCLWRVRTRDLRFSLRCLSRTPATRLEMRRFVLGRVHTATRFGRMAHLIRFRGRSRWNPSAAFWTPSSLSIRTLNSLAAYCAFSDNATLIPSSSLSTVNSLNGIGLGPAPALATISPQNFWSPKKDTTTVGFPHFSPIAVVPAPP